MISLNKKSFKKVCKVIVISSISLILVMFVLTKVIYDSVFVRYDSDTVVASALAELAESREIHTVMSGKNNLRGYLYSGERDTLVIVTPGYKASADDYLWQIKSMNEYGFAVFSFDTTGSCESGGKSAIGFSQEIFDLRAVIEYIENHGKFGYNNLMIFGHSRGGYSACAVLNEYDISAVVSVSGINSSMDAVVEPAVSKIGVAAYGNYPMLWIYQSMLFGSNVVDIKATEEIEKSDARVLIVHGADDLSESGRCSIYSYKDKIKSDNVTFYLCKQKGHSGHTDLLFDDDGAANKQLMSVVNEFFAGA